MRSGYSGKTHKYVRTHVDHPGPTAEENAQMRKKFEENPDETNEMFNDVKDKWQRGLSLSPKQIAAIINWRSSKTSLPPLTPPQTKWLATFMAEAQKPGAYPAEQLSTIRSIEAFYRTRGSVTVKQLDLLESFLKEKVAATSVPRYVPAPGPGPAMSTAQASAPAPPAEGSVCPTCHQIVKGESKSPVS
jgi:hypothetical protein